MLGEVDDEAPSSGLLRPFNARAVGHAAHAVPGTWREGPVDVRVAIREEEDHLGARRIMMRGMLVESHLHGSAEVRPAAPGVRLDDDESLKESGAIGRELLNEVALIVEHDDGHGVE